MPRKDIAGQRFGRLVAVAYQYDNEQGRPCWLFRCDCGNEKILPERDVQLSRTRSCGCLVSQRMQQLNRQDITGQRFGRLTVLHPTEDRDASGSICWECRCDCGGTARYSVSALRSGRIHSCGCLYTQTRPDCTSHRRDMVADTALGSLVASKRPRRNNTSGCTGVSYDQRRKQYVAYIYFQKRKYHLGTFPSQEQAINARKEAERRLHDPILLAQIARLTDRSREKLAAYIAPGVGDAP